MEIIQFENYKAYKERFDRCMNATANNFVMIGYLLKQAKETNILNDSGYSRMGEFARNEYGLDESMTSRFISICERYGNGESSLLPEYEPFGYAKLSEMLALPDNISEMITPEMTREEIREIKKEVKEEQAISPIEVSLEGNKAAGEIIEVEVLKEYFRIHTDEFRKVYGLGLSGETDINQKLADILAPAGLAVLIQRVQGRGKYMIKIEGIQKPITFVDVREETNRAIEWADMYEFAKEAVGLDILSPEITAEEKYREMYGAEMPLEEEKKEDEKKTERVQTEKKVKKQQKTAKTDTKLNKTDTKEEIAPAQEEEKGKEDTVEEEHEEEASPAAEADEIRQAYHKTFRLIREMEKYLGEREWGKAYTGADVLAVTIEWISAQAQEQVNEALDAEFDNE